MNHNGVVSSLPLDLGHLYNHGSDTGQVGAAAIGSPVGQVELNHPLSLARLEQVEWPKTVRHTDNSITAYRSNLFYC